jgi:phage terminase large subunit-like protein
MEQVGTNNVVVSASTASTQAELSVDTLANMVEGLDGWKFNRAAGRKGLYCHGNSFKPIAMDPKRADGITPHLLIADEAARLEHAFFFRLMSAAGKLPNGLMLMITTSEGDLSLPWAVWRKDAERRLLAREMPDHWAIHHWQAQAGSRLDDVEQWKNANPLLLCPGGHVTVESLTERWEGFKLSSAGTDEWRTQYLNLPAGAFCESEIDPVVLERQRFDWSLDDYRGCPAYVFIDFSLGAVHGGKCDLTAVAVVVNAGEYGLLRTWAFAAGDMERIRQDRPWLWEQIQGGYVSHSAQDVVDLGMVETLLADLKSRFDLQVVGVDPVGWSYQWANQVLIQRHELPVEARSQRQIEAAPAWATFKHLLASKGLRYFDDPVLLDQIAHASVYVDPNGNSKPQKGRSERNIDNLVAAYNAARLYDIRGRSNAFQPASGVMIM